MLFAYSRVGIPFAMLFGRPKLGRSIFVILPFAALQVLSCILFWLLVYSQLDDTICPIKVFIGGELS